jgi:hypothetical protein
MKQQCHPLDCDDGFRTAEVKVSKRVIIDKSHYPTFHLCYWLILNQMNFHILTSFCAGLTPTIQFRYGKELLAFRPTPSWRIAHCRLSATIYFTYSQLPSISGGRLISPNVRARGETNGGVWWGNLKQRERLEDIGVDGRIILKGFCNK